MSAAEPHAVAPWLDMDEGDVITLLRCRRGHFLPWPIALRPFPDECPAANGETASHNVVRCGSHLSANTSRFRKVEFR